MLFSTKYHKWYSALIERAKSENRSKNNDYLEDHHIIPKSLGGNNSKNNRVLLTLREHFVAHLLLTKMYSGKERSKMIWALHRLTYSDKNYSSHQYEITRKLHIKNVSNPKSEETKNKMRKPKSDKHKLNISLGAKEGWKNRSKEESVKKLKDGYSKMVEEKGHPRAGKKLSIETKNKISSSLLGNKASLETKHKLSILNSGKNNSMYGKKHSEETRAKMKAVWERRKLNKIKQEG